MRALLLLFCGGGRAGGWRQRSYLKLHDRTKAACLAALTDAHRAQVLKVIAEFNNENISLDAAAAAVGRILNGNEISAMATLQHADLDSWHEHFRQRRRVQVKYISLPVRALSPSQAGLFAVGALGDPGVLSPQMETEFHVPSPGPQ